MTSVRFTFTCSFHFLFGFWVQKTLQSFAVSCLPHPRPRVQSRHKSWHRGTPAGNQRLDQWPKWFGHILEWNITEKCFDLTIKKISIVLLTAIFRWILCDSVCSETILRKTNYQYKTLHSQTEHDHQCRKCLKAAEEFPRLLAGRFQGIHRSTWKRWTLAHNLKQQITDISLMSITRSEYIFYFKIDI